MKRIEVRDEWIMICCCYGPVKLFVFQDFLTVFSHIIVICDGDQNASLKS